MIRGWASTRLSVGSGPMSALHFTGKIFHTREELNPWMRLQLYQPSIITSVTVYNRKSSIFLSLFNYHFFNTLRVESFAGRNFRGDKLPRTPMVKIKFGGYKLSRKWQILVKFSFFDAIF